MNKEATPPSPLDSLVDQIREHTARHAELVAQGPSEDEVICRLELELLQMRLRLLSFRLRAAETVRYWTDKDCKEKLSSELLNTLRQLVTDVDDGQDRPAEVPAAEPPSAPAEVFTADDVSTGATGRSRPTPRGE